MNITVLGSTGSIGTQTLQIARENPDINVLGLSAYSDINLLEQQIREFRPRLACVVDEHSAEQLKERISDTDTEIVSGADGLCAAAAMQEIDMVLTAVVGISGLVPTIAAIKSGKTIALANKETLVTGGHIVTRLARENGVPIIPVDSEHSAIFQSLQGCADCAQIKRILLTASGGPFFGKTAAELRSVTPEQALKHPNWSMGAKVTVDSSTLVNKGLEVIEAKWLFNVPVDKIDVLVHRQSVVHSMVEFCDNGIIAQLGAPDMRLPIQYALTYPNRLPMRGNELNFSQYTGLTFEKPDTKTFRALELAYEAGRSGGLLPTMFNSADEAAVEMFLRRKISYTAITDLIEYAMSKSASVPEPTVDDILAADLEARRYAYEFAENKL